MNYLVGAILALFSLNSFSCPKNLNVLVVDGSIYGRAFFSGDDKKEIFGQCMDHYSDKKYAVHSTNVLVQSNNSKIKWVKTDNNRLYYSVSELCSNITNSIVMEKSQDISLFTLYGEFKGKKFEIQTNSKIELLEKCDEITKDHSGIRSILVGFNSNELVSLEAPGNRDFNSPSEVCYDLVQFVEARL